MSGEQDDVYLDTLFVGLTRPATILGISYTAFVIEFVTVTIVFLAVGNPLYLLLILPVHSMMYLISANNPNVFSALMLWVKTNGRCRNQAFWGSVSFSPKPLKKWKD